MALNSLYCADMPLSNYSLTLYRGSLCVSYELRRDLLSIRGFIDFERQADSIYTDR